MKAAHTGAATPLSILAGAALFIPQLMTAGPGPAPAGINGQRLHLAESYGKLPLGFEANRGQTDSGVRFLSRGNGYTLFLTENEAVLSLKKAAGAKAPGATKSPDKRPADSVLRMKLIGSNSGAPVAGADELPGKSNYFIGSDPKKWRANVPNYARVKYQGVYPGVDLVYYGNQEGLLEYDFLVAPGANPSAIRFALDGVPKIDPNGDLVIKTEGGAVRFQKPVVYQPAMNHGSRKVVDGHYVLRAGNQVGFEVPSYDRTRPLVIDPALTWSTYLGGTGDDFANGIAVDSNGNAYVTGYTYSNNFPTMNPYQGTNKAAPNATVFVAELNAAGTALVYSTYLGGTGNDLGEAIAVDSFGDAYVTGQTASADFPAVNSLQPFNGRSPNNPDAFVTELNPGGSALLYSTYLGGIGPVGGYGIAVDSSGNTYVTGLTISAGFPLVNAYQTTFTGFEAAFVTKLNFSSSALTIVYSTYLGGNNSTQGLAIAVDSLGDAYVTGFTSATNFPTINPIQPGCSSCGAGPADAFVAELNAAGSALVYSTYLGGSGAESGRGIAVDASGSAYVTGYTYSPDFPTMNPFQATCGSCGAGASNAFVAKLNPGGTALVYSTYLGGSWYDFGYGIAVDSSGNAYVTGITQSSDFPLLNWLDPALQYGEAAYVTELNAAGSALIYSTYLGGNGSGTGQGVAVDSFGNTYVAGSTGSTNFPTVNPVQATYGGGGDAFVVKMAPGASAVTLSPPSLTFGPQSLGATSTAQTLTVNNTGNAPLLFLSVTASGDFAETDNCSGSGVSAGASCAISVTFTPESTGTLTGAITISDNAATSPQSARLTGTGIQPTVKVSPALLLFGNQQTGVTGAPRTVTLTNTGGAPLVVSNINTSGGDFALTSATPCGSSVSAGASCTIGLTFEPTRAGLRGGTLTIADNAPNSPQVVLLAGTGVVPTVSVSPPSLSFGPQAVRVVSAPQTVTLTNTGTVALTVSDIEASGDFAQTSTCATLSAGASCTIGVTFKPTTPGARTGTLKITDNATDSPQKVPLTGTGLGAAASLSPGSLTFGPQNPGSTSAPQTVTLTNTGAAALIVIIATSGDFAQTNTCGNSVAAGASCTVSVTFTPAASGARSGTLTFRDNASDSPQKVGLTGTGSGAAAGVSPAFLSFGSVSVGASATQFVTLTNTGTVNLSVSIAASGDFALTGPGCQGSLGPGAGCDFSITFTPSITGLKTGTLTITDNPASPLSAPLTGTGVVLKARVSPTSMSFGNVTVGSTSASQTLTLTNTGTAPLTSLGFSLSDSYDFAQTNTCGSSLKVGAGCAVNVTFTPSKNGSFSVTGTETDKSVLTIGNNGVFNPLQVSLTGTAEEAVAGVSPTSLSFNPAPVGSTNPYQTKTVTLTNTNTGGATLTVSGISISGDFGTAGDGGFTETDNCVGSLSAGTSCTIAVTFTPPTTDILNAALTINGNASNGPQIIQLDGSGTTCVIDCISAAPSLRRNAAQPTSPPVASRSR